jgi:hypothetical protein
MRGRPVSPDLDTHPHHYARQMARWTDDRAEVRPRRRCSPSCSPTPRPSSYAPLPRPRGGIPARNTWRTSLSRFSVRYRRLRQRGRFLAILRGLPSRRLRPDVGHNAARPTVVALLASVSGPTNQSVARVSTETARRCPRCPEQEWTRSGESPRGLAQAIPALRWRQAADRQSQQEIPAPTQPVSRERFLTRPACDSA